MPIVQLDPSLINSGGGVNAFQNAFTNALKMRASQQELDDNQYKIDALKEERGQQNALAQLLANQAFDPKSAQGQAQMYGAGGVKNTQGYLKGMGDLAKTNAETAKHEVETKKISAEVVDKKSANFQNLLNTVQTPQQAAQWLKGAYSDPDLAPMLGSVSTYEEAVSRIGQDPQSFATWKQQAGLTASKLADVLHQQVVADETGRSHRANEKISVDNNTATNKTSRDNNFDNNARMAADAAAGRGVTMRGQNMTDARSRESNAASMSKPFEVTGEDGKPVLVRQDRQGNISRVEGFAPKSGAEKPMTDAQSKAALFGSRMEASNKIVGDLAKSGTDTSIPFSNAGYGIGSAVTALGGSNNQQLQQAKRDFINATLRRESGAVISPSEFDNGEKQYFPQLGDSAAVIQQKANNRAIATRGVQAEIPKAQRGVVREIIGGGNSDIDALLNKYK
jgi:hypothetical protein